MGAGGAGGFSGGGAAGGFMGAKSGGAQSGRTQNKTYGEIMQIAPLPKPMQIPRGGQGVGRGDLTGSALIPPDIGVAPSVQDKKEGTFTPAMGADLAKAYDRIFGPKPFDPAGETQTPAYKEYRRSEWQLPTFSNPDMTRWGYM